MSTNDVKIRRNMKRNAVAKRIKEITPMIDALVDMMDESQLDQLILGLAIGSVWLGDPNA